MSRTAALIVDSGDIARFDGAVAAGEMPNLAAFLGEAAWAPTRSPVSHRSEMAWAQFLSGKSAEAIDWYGWWNFFPDRYETIGTGAAMVEPFYARDPVETIVADVIQSHARPEVPGSQVFAWGAHSPQFPRSSVPAGLYTEMAEAIGPNLAFGNDHPLGWFDAAYLQALGDAAVDGLGRRSELTRWLVERTPGWQFLLSTVSEYHAVGHHAWHGVDPDHILAGSPTAAVAGRAERATLAAVDEHIGAFLDIVGDATVVIGALHGFQPADDVVNCVLLPELMHRLAFGKAAMRDPDQKEWRAAGMPPVMIDADREWSRTVRGRFVPGLRDLPMALSSRAPDAVYDSLRRFRGKSPRPPRSAMTPRDLVEADLDDESVWTRAEDLAREVPHWYRRFWPAMRAFAIPSFDDGRIRVNLAGRERDGIVAPADYEQVLADLAVMLDGITDARTGEKLVQEVLFDRAGDPMADGGPDADIVIRWRCSTDAIEHPDVGTIGPEPFMRTASHREEGWYAVRGAGATPGRASEVRDPFQFSAIVDGLRRGRDYDAALVDAIGRGC